MCTSDGIPWYRKRSSRSLELQLLNEMPYHGIVVYEQDDEDDDDNCCYLLNIADCSSIA